VISCVALFASLGGTGYAATQIHSGATAAKSKKAAKAVTKSEVNKLIAAYVKAHHLGPGTAGPQGPAGGIGPIGPQGPGVTPISDEVRGEAGFAKVATLGPWTIEFSCKAGAVGVTRFTGPGSIDMTVIYGVANQPAEKIYDNNSLIGAESVSAIGANGQMSFEGFLKSGTTIEHVSLLMMTEKGIFDECKLVGDGIPVSS
jgi:hypothetical protein